MRTPSQKRGSVLVLVTLLTLVLASFAIVALRSVSRTVQASASYTTRHQSQETSSSANRMASRYVGERYAGVWREMQVPMAINGKLGGTADLTIRKDTIMRGPYLYMTADRFDDFLAVGVSSTKTGLFADNSVDSFEQRKTATYNVIVRDPYDFPPPPGESAVGNTCSKKIAIFSEATVGELDTDWTAANNVGRMRIGLEGIIANVDCGT